MLKKAKIITGIIIAVAASCGKNVLPQDTASDGIFFNTAVQTRSVIEDAEGLQQACNTSSPDYQSVAILGTMYGQGQTRVLFDNVPLSYSADAAGWSYSPSRYWISGYEYRFWAVYPYSEQPQYKMADDYGSVTVENYKIIGENIRTDLMLGTSYRDQRQGVDASVVPVTMQHTLAAVDFRIRNGSGLTVNSISNVRFVGMKCQCDIGIDAAASLSVGSDRYSSVADDSTTPYTGLDFSIPEDGMTTDLNVYYDMTGGALVTVPQRVVTSTAITREIRLAFDVEFNNGSQSRVVNLSENTTASTEEWEAGKRYIYNITLTSSDITFEVVVVDWIDDIVQLD